MVYGSCYLRRLHYRAYDNDYWVLQEMLDTLHGTSFTECYLVWTDVAAKKHRLKEREILFPVYRPSGHSQRSKHNGIYSCLYTKDVPQHFIRKQMYFSLCSFLWETPLWRNTCFIRYHTSISPLLYTIFHGLETKHVALSRDILRKLSLYLTKYHYQVEDCDYVDKKLRAQTFKIFVKISLRHFKVKYVQDNS